MIWLRFAYAWFWLRFKVVWLFRPYASITPTSSNGRWWIGHKYGFILFTPGIPGRRCGRRIMLSWLSWRDGPCSFGMFVSTRASCAAEGKD